MIAGKLDFTDNKISADACFFNLKKSISRNESFVVLTSAEGDQVYKSDSPYNAVEKDM